MKSLSRMPVLVFLLLCAWGAGARAEAPETEQVQADLLSEVSEVAAGEPFTLGVRLRMKEGWHTYWRNPGDSGLPTRIEWTLPEGFSAGGILWPTPERFLVGPVANFGYADETVLLTEIAPPAQLAPGTQVPVRAKVSWLVCQEECIPGGAELDLTLRVAGGESVLDAAGGARIAQARAQLPGPAPFAARLEADDAHVTLRVDDPALASSRIESAYFFPTLDVVLDHVAAQTLSVDDAGLALRMQPSALASAPPQSLDGLLVLQEDVGGAKVRHAFTVRAESAAPAGAQSDLGLFQVLVFALLGGVVLNLMPCVFPILSLKVLGVVQQAAESPRRVRLHGVAYTAGTLASFALLAGVLLALRAGGASIGWGFQLQSPGFVAVLAYVLFAMGLSLSGVLYFGGSVAGVGRSLMTRPGLTGSFFTGVLATVVATPCTAPFMGAALGFALTQPALVGLIVFLALGFGLALPFLLLSFVPGARRLLPRPGAWMETLKQVLAFPLYGTVAWLVWVLQLQAGSTGLAAVLAGLVLVGFGAWAFGASRMAGTTMRRIGSVVTAAAVTGALLLSRMPEGTAAQPGGTAQAEGFEPFTQARLDELRAAGKPVFVNFTAAWCVTCLVNERTAMGVPRVREAFEQKGVTYLKGDWTNRDAEITRVLERFGRSGVPLYLLYSPGSAEPTVLPQLLTEATVLDHLGAL